MANDSIKITVTNDTIKARELLSLVDKMRSAYEQAVKVKSIMDHLQDGVDFTTLEAMFGLPVDEGNTVYDLVNGAVGAMTNVFQNSNCRDITEKLG